MFHDPDPEKLCGSKRALFFILLSAFLLPALILSLLLICHQIVPFGDTTLLFSDLDTQYVEFMAEYRRVLLGDGSFFWSWHAGLGMNFIALIAYYLASPFNILLIFFSENQLPQAVSLLTVLKLSSAGTAFSFYLWNKDHRKSLLLPLFSACYALSTFTLGYMFNLMWLDALIWLPLLCMGIDRLNSSGRKEMSLLIILFTLSFVSQFYMAWMTGLFCALYFLAQLIIRKTAFRNCLRLTALFGICVAVAAGLSAFLLLPTYFVLKNNMGLLGQEIPQFFGQFPFLKIFQKIFIGSFDGIKDCLPHIYCGLPALIGTVFFFTGSKISVREKMVTGIVMIILLFSFWFAPLDFLWHAMDHPSWFPYRYAFVFCFWILTLAYKGFSEGEKTNLLTSSAFVFFLAVVSVLFYDGDRVGLLLLNGSFLTGYIVINCIRREIIRRVLWTVLVITELFLNGNLIIANNSGGYTKADDFWNYHGHYRTLVSRLLPDESDFYRIEKNEYRNYNDALGIGYPGISHFSSTASVRQAEFLKRLGFNCYATWCTYEGSTSASDALLGIRYEMWGSGKQDSIHLEEDIIEHPARFPLFFFSSSEFARYDFFGETDAITRQDDLLRLLEGNGAETYFEPVPVNITHFENLKTNNGKDYFKVDSSRDAFFEAEIKPVPGRSLYLFLPGASLSHTVRVNDSDELMNGGRDYSPFPICLDAYTAGERVKIRVEAVSDALIGGVEAFALDTERLSALSDSINTAAPRMVRTGNTSFRLETDAENEDRLIVSSIPFDAGWQVKINDQRQPLKSVFDSILGFILPAGMETVEITYQPYGWNIGLMLSGVSLLIWGILILFETVKRTGDGK